MTDFRHHGDRLVHQGYIWKVVVGEFESPDGERFTRDIVRSPGAVAAVPVRSDASGTPHVVLVRQYRAPFDSAVVEVPAGMRDIPDEPTELTAERELVEEVGLRPGRLEHLVDFFPSVGMTDAVLAVYLATDLEDVGRETHGPEEAHMDVIEVPLTEAVAMIERGEIHDAKTIIGLLLAERRLRERGAL
ncbi:MAG: NUDIX domain-containing protein [Ilumatobacteraceae bacterium]|jgi:ADP-ribose pyrophosphatase